MNLKLSKTTTCRLNARGTWGERAAAWMGLSFFLRMVYYFGFMNLKDVPTGEIVFSVVLALAISVAFILMLKLKKLLKQNSLPQKKLPEKQRRQPKLLQKKRLPHHSQEMLNNGSVPDGTPERSAS